VRHQPAIRHPGDDVGERATTVDPELPTPPNHPIPPSCTGKRSSTRIVLTITRKVTQVMATVKVGVYTETAPGEHTDFAPDKR
jgi:hypothetical protein